MEQKAMGSGRNMAFEGQHFGEDVFDRVNRLELVAERDRLQAEVERLRSAIATAYGYLWCVNNEPGTPWQYPPERAAYAARKALRELLTKEQRGAAINEALTKVHEAVRNDGLDA